ncbi:Origin recognition complex subunit 5 [Irineochytrium annulatum]|nr:Origin recognition complex subunit 5 [Irineochytrium annulatum]
MGLSVPAVFVYGHSATGKTSVIRHAFADELHAFIDCIECFAPRLLFHRILRQLGKASGDEDMTAANDNFTDFTRVLRRYLLGTKSNNVTLVLQIRGHDVLMKVQIFDNAERLEFIDVVYPLLKPASVDLIELREMIESLYPKYTEPIVKNGVGRDEKLKLYTNIQFHVKTAIANLQAAALGGARCGGDGGGPDSPDRRLPKCTAFLLVAAYLASYSPPRLDVRLFSRGPEGRRRLTKERTTKRTQAKPTLS